MKILLLSFILIPSLIFSLQTSNSKQDTEQTFVELTNDQRMLIGFRIVQNTCYALTMGTCTIAFAAVTILSFIDLFKEPQARNLKQFNDNQQKLIVISSLLFGGLSGFFTWHSIKNIPKDFKKAFYGKEELSLLS